MKLGPAELTHYYDPPLQIGKYVVHGRGMENQLANDGGTGKLAHLKESSIDRIVDWSKAAGPLKYRETLLKRLGTLPMGMDDYPYLDRDVYLYNPENLPGLHEIKPTIVPLEGGGVSLSVRSLVHCAELNINGELYVIAMESLTGDDYEY
ncbi:hypothetical protein [Asticcacaulis excentricus]|uniref:hypothetical protein n=1 Tax=Asticcacaulis excentricus TaxID=78587 RepID=UPI000F826DB3|nr:hypothetical protein [Asticcacaulis excentricus]